MTTTRYDVWFDDDGSWRIDERNLTEDEARWAMATLKAHGYAAKALTHDPDYTVNRRSVWSMKSAL